VIQAIFHSPISYAGKLGVINEGALPRVSYRSDATFHNSRFPLSAT
jgi:hypothetical protein